MKKKPAYITPDFYIYRLALMKASQRCKLLSLGSDETVAFLCFYMLLTWIYKNTVSFQNCSQARAGIATLEMCRFLMLVQGSLHSILVLGLLPCVQRFI